MNNDARVQELLECNNRLLEEGRSARRELAEARFEVEVLRREAFASAEALKAKRQTIREQVLEFHRIFDHPTADKPNVPIDRRVTFRLSLVGEEFCELLEATYGVRDVAPVRAAILRLLNSGDVQVHLPQFVDALADIDYVVEGTRLEFGIDGGSVAAEVHRANMGKLWPDGTIHKTPEGKTRKPPGWTPPDIEGVLRAQRWEGQ